LRKKREDQLAPKHPWQKQREKQKKSHHPQKDRNQATSGSKGENKKE